MLSLLCVVVSVLLSLCCCRCVVVSVLCVVCCVLVWLFWTLRFLPCAKPPCGPPCSGPPCAGPPKMSRFFPFPATVWALGLCRQGFTRQPENSKRAHLRLQKHHQNSTRRHPEYKKSENGGGRGKKERNFGPPKLRAHPSGPDFFWVWAPPFGPDHDRHTQIQRDWPKMDWPKIGLAKTKMAKMDWPKLVKSGWPTRDWPESVPSPASTLLLFGLRGEKKPTWWLPFLFSVHFFPFVFTFSSSSSLRFSCLFFIFVFSFSALDVGPPWTFIFYHVLPFSVIFFHFSVFSCSNVFF